MTLTDDQLKHLLRTVLPTLSTRIQNLQSCLSHLESPDAILYATAVSQTASGMPHGGTVTDKVAAAAFSADKVQAGEARQIHRELSACQSLFDQTSNAIALLPAQTAKIFSLQVYSRKSFSEISQIVGYSESQCKRRYKTALALLRATLFLSRQDYDELTRQ